MLRDWNPDEYNGVPKENVANKTNRALTGGDAKVFHTRGWSSPLLLSEKSSPVGDSQGSVSVQAYSDLKSRAENDENPGRLSIELTSGKSTF